MKFYFDIKLVKTNILVLNSHKPISKKNSLFKNHLNKKNLYKQHVDNFIWKVKVQATVKGA